MTYSNTHRVLKKQEVMVPSLAHHFLILASVYTCRNLAELVISPEM